MEKTIKAANPQTHEDHDIDVEADLEQGLVFAIECGEVEGLKMPARVRTFEAAGIRAPRRGVVVSDAGGREFQLTIVRSDEAASEGIRDWFLGPISAVLPRSLPSLRR